ncbi:hypothetical protein ABZ344_27720, partial [Streptomyces olivaceus]
AAPGMGAAPLSYAGIRASAFRRKARPREAPHHGVPGGSPTGRRRATGAPDYDDGPRDGDAYGWTRTAGTHAAGDRSTAARSDPALPKQPPPP